MPYNATGSQSHRYQDGAETASTSQPVAGASAPSPALRTQIIFRRGSHSLAHTNSAQQIGAKGDDLTAAPDRASRPSTADSLATPTRSTASYFDTYTPYKLNPALTPSTRDRRDKARSSKPKDLDTRTPGAASISTPEARLAPKPLLEAVTGTVHQARAGSAYSAASTSPSDNRIRLPPSSTLSAPQTTSRRPSTEAFARAGCDQRAIETGKAASIGAYKRTSTQCTAQTLQMKSDPVRKPLRDPQSCLHVPLEKPASPPVTQIRPPLVHSVSSPSQSSPATFSRTQDTYDSDSDGQSFDSVTREAQKVRYPTAEAQERTTKKSLGPAGVAATSAPARALPSSTLPKSLRHATSFPDRRRAQFDSSETPTLPGIQGNLHRFGSPQGVVATNRGPGSLPGLPTRERAGSKDSTSSIALPSSDGSLGSSESVQAFVRSSRLTRILLLEDPPHKNLRVSLADVGAPNGHPVFVFLGLGAVRYLVGLYDELASLLGLRLICVDRWGLGKTDDAPNEKRGLLEWGSIIYAVANQLQIARFSILAHSAGAPFAMATVLQQPNRICGPVHLLAPWVSADFDFGYKWLRYVPEQIIRTAQTAEWKLAGWKLGKGDTDGHSARTSDTVDPDARSSGSSILSRPEGTRARCSSVAGDMRSSTLGDASIALRSPLGKSSLRASPTPVKTKTSFLSSIFTPRNGPSRKSSNSGEDFFEGSDLEILSPTMRSDEDYLVTSREPQVGKGEEDRSRPNTPTGRLIRKYRPRNGSASQSIHISPADLDFPASLLRTRDSVLVGPVGHCEAVASPTGPSHSGKSETWPNRHSGSPSKATFPSLDASESQGKAMSSAPPTMGPRSAHPPLTAPGALAQTATGTNTADLATSLLRASHAESLRGSTPDLLTILGTNPSSSGSSSSSKKTQPWGFTFSDVSHPLKVWQGDKDERIGLGSAFWLERECAQCELRVVKGAGHGLMTNSKVMMEVLESLASYKDAS